MNERDRELEAFSKFIGALEPWLAITGIYAVMAFSVSQRTQEIAIRMALGAQRWGIAKLVLITGAKLALLGCSLGVLGSLAASRLVGSFLFGVRATDPFVYLAAILIMMLMARFSPQRFPRCARLLPTPSTLLAQFSNLGRAPNTKFKPLVNRIVPSVGIVAIRHR